MPSAEELEKRGKPIRVRVKTLPNGQKVRIFVYKSKGKQGGHTTGEPIKKGK